MGGVSLGGQGFVPHWNPPNGLTGDPDEVCGELPEAELLPPWLWLFGPPQQMSPGKESPLAKRNGSLDGARSNSLRGGGVQLQARRLSSAWQVKEHCGVP